MLRDHLTARRADYLDDLGRRPRAGRALAGERQCCGAPHAPAGAGADTDFPASRPGISVSFLSRGRELLSLSDAYLTGRLGNLVEVPGTGHSRIIRHSRWIR